MVNNKDNRVFMSRNYRSDSCPLTETLYCLIRVQWLSVVYKMRRFYRFSEVLEESLDVSGLLNSCGD